jgi:hypothetical protein
MSKHATLEIKPQMVKDLERLIGWFRLVWGSSCLTISTASYLLVERQRRHHTF